MSDDVGRRQDLKDNPGTTKLPESPGVVIPFRSVTEKLNWGVFRRLHPEVLPVFFCLAIPLLCVLAAWPFADAGFNDDWSYSDIALRFAETGHFHFNGWLWSTVLFQMVWGAAWIRLFGFSFDVLRVATFPFALGFVWLVYALARKTGLRRDLACFGALILGTSPLYIPLAASFMTDVYGCFFIALCLYAAIQSVEATGSKSAMVWLWILAISGVLGGSDRQIVWVAPFALIPYLIWVRRTDRAFFIQATAAYAICICLLAVVIHRYMPAYGPLQISRNQGPALLIHGLLPGLGKLNGFFLASLQSILPALLCFAPLWKRLKGSEILAICLGSAALVCFSLLSRLGVAPFLSSVLSAHGILPRGIDALGYRPVLLNPMLRLGMSLLIAFSGLCLLSRRMPNARLAPASKSVFVIFSLPYIALLLPAAMTGVLHDRYVLPLVPLLLIVCLCRFQTERRRIPAIAWLCGVAFALYGIVITHDYAGALRARAEAAHTLETRGVPRRQVSAGFEFDGWTQLQLAQSIAASDEHRWNETNVFWFWSDTKALRPEYVVVNSLASDKPRDHLPKVEYMAWTPPFWRAAIVSKREDLPKSKICSSAQPCAP